MGREESFQKLSSLYQEMRRKAFEHSDLLKRAAASNWDPTLLKQADCRMEEARTLNEEFKELLGHVEATLVPEEREAMEAMEEMKRTMKPDAVPRLWKRDLSPHSMSPTAGQTIEQAIEGGIERILTHIPITWLHEQLGLYSLVDHKILRAPLVLYGSSRVGQIERPVHSFAYGLILALELLSDSTDYDIYDGAMLVPQIAALCLEVDALCAVKGGIAKLRELSFAPDIEMPGRIYELLIAARCARLGRGIEFLNRTASRTPDLRINDFGFPAVVECKRQSTFSAYELREIQKMSEIFRVVCE